MADKKTFDLWMTGYAIQGNSSDAEFEEFCRMWKEVHNE